MKIISKRILNMLAFVLRILTAILVFLKINAEKVLIEMHRKFLSILTYIHNSIQIIVTQSVLTIDLDLNKYM